MAVGLAFLVVVEKSFDKVLTKKQLENETENLLHSFLPFLIIMRDKEIPWISWFSQKSEQSMY